MNDIDGVRSVRETRWYPVILAFTSGMTIMGVEMCSSRLIAPFFGTSLLVWTVIIGSVMIALTCGYYCGGILSERSRSIGFLAGMLFCAAGFVIVVPYILKPFMQMALSSMKGFDVMQPGAASKWVYVSIVCALVMSVLIISLPVAVFGMTSPYLIKLASLESDRIGYEAGKIYAYSTLGSILGTFLPSIVTIPLLGTRFSFLLFGGALLAVTLPGIGRFRTWFALAGCGLLLTGYLLAGSQAPIKDLPHLVEERETPYGFVQIFKRTGSDNVTRTWLRFNEGFGIQSLWIEGGGPSYTVHDALAFAPHLRSAQCPDTGTKRFLILGLAGGVLSSKLAQQHPGSIIDGVEIDGGLIDAVKPYFPLNDTENLNIHIADARTFVQRNTIRYDAIFVDAYRAPYIPFHLATVEFYASLTERLKECGLLVLNVLSIGKDFPPFKGIANSAAAVFPHVWFFEFRLHARDQLSSYIVVASMKDLGLDDPVVQDRLIADLAPTQQEAVTCMRSLRDTSVFPDSFFKRIRFDDTLDVFRDDKSALDVMFASAMMRLMTEGQEP